MAAVGLSSPVVAVVDFAATSPLADEFRATWATGRGFGFKVAFEVPGSTASEVEFRAEFAAESGRTALVVTIAALFETTFVTAVEISVSVCCADRTVPFAV
jgi:hypothetical protein